MKLYEHQSKSLMDQYFTKDLPASTLLVVDRLAHPDYLIEIEAVAVLG